MRDNCFAQFRRQAHAKILKKSSGEPARVGRYYGRNGEACHAFALLVYLFFALVIFAFNRCNYGSERAFDSSSLLELITNTRSFHQ